MKAPIYQVDAFTSHLFGGNPAAVVPLEQWPEDVILQRIAAENNLSETAFLVACAGGFELRWFTPRVEVDLCGHATLATAHILFDHLGHPGDIILFHTNRHGGGGGGPPDLPPGRRALLHHGRRHRADSRRGEDLPDR